ncbi:MAG: hypothetical protein ACTSRA_00005, partial [Promethearchaeota archaeon]
MTLRKENMSKRHEIEDIYDPVPYWICINEHAIEGGWTAKDSEDCYICGQTCPICGEVLHFHG